MKNMIDVSICIVNYKTDEELKRCLTSIKKFTKGISFEIIIIDNSKDNRWYSGGNNQALAKSKGKYVLFLNPDCYLSEDILAKLVSWMDRHPATGAIEPRQVYDNGETAPTGSLLPVWWVDGVELTGLSRWFGSVGRPGWLKEISERKVTPVVRSLLPWSTSTRPPAWTSSMRSRAGRSVPSTTLGTGHSATMGFGRTSDFFLRKKPGPSEKYRQVDKNRGENWQTEVVSGAAMMVRKSVLEKLGGFDEKLKLYYTDVDLCRRILDAGFEIWHLGKFSLGHSTRKSTGQLKWDELYDIYAQDAWNYYRKWGEGVGGAVLFTAMKINKLIVKSGKRLGRLGK